MANPPPVEDQPEEISKLSKWDKLKNKAKKTSAILGASAALLTAEACKPEDNAEWPKSNNTKAVEVETNVNKSNVDVDFAIDSGLSIMGGADGGINIPPSIKYAINKNAETQKTKGVQSKSANTNTAKKKILPETEE